ncbi:unnamed protein product [Aphanomyces euteiches]
MPDDASSDNAAGCIGPESRQETTAEMASVTSTVGYGSVQKKAAHEKIVVKGTALPMVAASGVR